MPITPKFNLDQTDTHLQIKIFASYSSLQSTEAYVDEKSFLFASYPYFLRLNFKQKLVIDEDPRCVYNSDDNSYLFEIEKLKKSEFFENLSCFNLLLSDGIAKQEVKKQQKRVGIEVLDDGSNSDSEDSKILDLEAETDHLDQDLIEKLKIDPASESDINQTCLFANLENFHFNEVHPLFQIKDLTLPRDQRLKLAQDVESFDFSLDHYLSDLYEDQDQT